MKGKEEKRGGENHDTIKSGRREKGKRGELPKYYSLARGKRGWRGKERSQGRESRLTGKGKKKTLYWKKGERVKWGSREEGKEREKR